MIVETCHLAGVFLLRAQAHGDGRGLFVETYSAAAFADAVGRAVAFEQDAVSRSADVGTVRGLHFQVPPYAQAKLVRVQRGRVFDVVLDLRRGQPTFGQVATFDLRPDDWTAVFIPAGCAHGFCTLEPDTEVIYKIEGAYSAAHAEGIHWADPDLGIDWPVAETDAVLSERDKTWPRLRDWQSVFE